MLRRKRVLLGLAAIAALALAVGDVRAHGNEHGEAKATIGNVKVTISYNRPALKGRDLTNMLRLLPGVQMTGDQDSLGGATGFGATMGAAQGVRSDNQNLTVDGIVGNDMGAPAGLKVRAKRGLCWTILVQDTI